jgi:D-glycero-D-manno-heptose 1,7-bisphosphate phosphatase
MVTEGRRRAVFLDRDGVLNRSPVIDGKAYAPRRLADFRLLPGVMNAVASLKNAGFLTIVVTNQPDIGNHLVSRETVETMHQLLRKRAAIDDIRVCPHRQDEGCACRKPKPGMLLDAAKDHHIDLKRSYMIGDRPTDVLAGSAVGCYTIFVQRGYAETRETIVRADAVVRSLPAASRHILLMEQQHK